MQFCCLSTRWWSENLDSIWADPLCPHMTSSVHVRIYWMSCGINKVSINLKHLVFGLWGLKIKRHLSVCPSPPAYLSARKKSPQEALHILSWFVLFWDKITRFFKCSFKPETSESLICGFRQFRVFNLNPASQTEPHFLNQRNLRWHFRAGCYGDNAFMQQTKSAAAGIKRKLKIEP